MNNTIVEPGYIDIVTPTVEQTIENNYQEIQSQIDNSISIKEGKLIAYDIGNKTTYLWDLNNNDILFQSEKRLVNISASPNQEKYVYFELNDNNGYKEGDIFGWEYLYMNGVPQKLLNIDLNKTDRFPFRWINDIQVAATEFNSETGNVHPTVNITINVDTGEKSILKLDFINPILDYKGLNINFAYSPQMTQVVFPFDGLSCVLYNLETKTQIAIRYDIECHLRVPQWKRDGSSFITSQPSYPVTNTNTELIEMDSNGGLSILTSLSSNPAPLRADYWQWSPDERYIAFWITYPDYVPEIKIISLGVYDTQSGITKDIQLPEDQIGTIQLIDNYQNTLIWSPDSNYVIFSNGHSDTSNKVILMDMESNNIKIFAENTMIYGWIK